MRDFLPEDVRKRAYVIGVIADVYERYGFEPLETPAVENIETLLGKYGEEGDRLIFKILKRGEEGRQTGEADLALRYDLTVPLARVVARVPAASCRSSSSATRFSRSGAPTGRRRGASASSTSATWTRIGSTSPVVEAEVCAAVARRARAARVHRLRDPAESSRAAARAARRRRACRADLHDSALVAHRQAGQGRASTASTAELERRGVASKPRRGRCRLSPVRVSTRQPHDAAVDARLASLAGGPRGRARARSQNLRAVIVALDVDQRRRATSGSIRAWRAACPITPAPSSRSPCADLAGSLGGGGRYDNLVGMFLGQSSARRAASRWGWSAFSW